MMASGNGQVQYRNSAASFQCIYQATPTVQYAVGGNFKGYESGEGSYPSLSARSGSCWVQIEAGRTRNGDHAIEDRKTKSDFIFFVKLSQVEDHTGLAVGRCGQF